MIDDLATMTDPSARHTELRARGVHQTPDGRWVVAGAVDVHRALTDPSLLVPVPPGDGPLDRLRRAMARFSHGPEHERRRHDIEAGIARLPIDALCARASALAAGALASGAPVDAADLTRAVLTAVLADALDLTAPVDAIARLSAMLAPVEGAEPPTRAQVAALVASVVGAPIDPARLAAFSLVHQARDATAGLVASALQHEDRDLDAAALADAPVQLTVRRASEGARLGGVDVPAGATVVVVLAAASTDPGRVDAFTDHPPTFGAGPHACPGVVVARALAGALVSAVRTAGAQVTRTGRFEERTNLRVPSVRVSSP